ncbi:hypothetical protein TNCV_3648041 [Trichonephila clavipes]|nr:hypothetical protein TNCV_3648041 [Trichonephila clavipes]
MLTLHYKAARGLLAKDFIIFNHSQVTRATPELLPSSSNFHTTPSREHSASTDLTCIGYLYSAGLQWHLDSNSRHSGREFVTKTTRLPKEF